MMRRMVEDKPQDGDPLHEDESRYRLVDREDMNGNESRDRRVDRMSVSEAAELLEVTQSAVRKRVHRGTIPWDKDSEGRIYVYVDLAETRPETGRDKSRDAGAGQSRDELLEAYRDQVDFLRRELERKDTLLMSLMQRVPELEPAPEPREAAAAPPESTSKGDSPTEPQEPAQRRSWLYRFFFGP
jgi:excisionase family DNA binding protein